MDWGSPGYESGNVADKQNCTTRRSAQQVQAVSLLPTCSW